MSIPDVAPTSTTPSSDSENTSSSPDATLPTASALAKHAEAESDSIIIFKSAHAKPEPKLKSEAASQPKAFVDAGAQGRQKLGEVQALFRRMKDDVAGDRYWRYQAAVSPGLQEYIEAFAFAFYLEHGALASRADVQASLIDEDGEVRTVLRAACCGCGFVLNVKCCVPGAIPTPARGLPTRRIGPHGRANAARDHVHSAAGWAGSRTCDERLCEGLQSRCVYARIALQNENVAFARIQFGWMVPGLRNEQRQTGQTIGAFAEL